MRKIKGVYYQIFAPEKIDRQSTINDSVKKLEQDFKGLKEYWDEICKIKEFYYVINDKYKGIPAPIYKKIAELKKSIKECLKKFINKDLKEIQIQK